MTDSTKFGGLGDRKRQGEEYHFNPRSAPPLFIQFINDDSREMGRGYFERGISNCPHLKAGWNL